MAKGNAMTLLNGTIASSFDYTSQYEYIANESVFLASEHAVDRLAHILLGTYLLASQGAGMCVRRNRPRRSDNCSRNIGF